MLKNENLEKLINPATSVLNSHPSSWVEIDASAFNHNIAQYKSVITPALLAPVIKSNAYGHGIEIMAKLCEQNNQIDYICVVALSEALFLRSIGIQKPILVLSIIDGELESAVAYNIGLVVFDLATVQELDRIGNMLNKKVHVHIKIDTGLSRLGISETAALSFIETVHRLPHIFVGGIFTHFASSEKEDQTFTNLQIDRFNFVIDQLAARGIHIPLKHTSCSAAITGNHRSHHTMARMGIGIYGLWPSQENKIMTQHVYPHFSLRPVLTWKTRIMLVKEISAGSYVGYDQTFKAEKNIRIATLPIGYWDGYDRRLSNKGTMLVHGQRAPVVGRIAMNLTMIDVTGIPAAVGDEVTLLGSQTGVTADDLAHQCDTINYEIVTRINPLAPRVAKETAF